MIFAVSRLKVAESLCFYRYGMFLVVRLLSGTC